MNYLLFLIFNYSIQFGDERLVLFYVIEHTSITYRYLLVRSSLELNFLVDVMCSFILLIRTNCRVKSLFSFADLYITFIGVDISLMVLNILQ